MDKKKFFPEKETNNKFDFKTKIIIDTSIEILDLEKHNEKKKTVLKVIIPENMKRSTSKNYSYYAIEWLNFISEKTGEKILHAKNGGEVVIKDPEKKTKTGKFKHYFLDGYCRESNTIYEFNGSHTHGHIKTEKDKKNKFLLERNKKTLWRENRLRQLGFVVVSIWSDDWKNSEERLEFIQNKFK